MSILQQLKDFTVSRAHGPEAKTITLGDSSQTFYFRKISYFDASKIDVMPLKSHDGKMEIDPAKLVDRNFAILAASLTDESGAERVSVADLSSIDLDSEFGNALLTAANEVNGLKAEAVKEAKKNSDATINGDTSSV